MRERPPSFMDLNILTRSLKFSDLKEGHTHNSQ